MGQNKEKQWQMLKKRLEGYKAQWNRPTYTGAVRDYIPCTALMGNGDLAVTSSGNQHEKSYILAKGDFWNCGDMKTNALCGTNPKRVSPLTIGGVTIKGKQNSENWQTASEVLDLTYASLKTELTMNTDVINLKTWVAATENIQVIEIRSNSTRQMPIECILWTKEEYEEWRVNSWVEQEQGYMMRKTVNLAPENTQSWLSEVVVGMACIGGANLQVKPLTKGSLQYTFNLEPTKPIYLLVALGGGGQTYNHQGELQKTQPSEEAKHLLQQYANEEAVQSLYNKHSDWWQDYWLKSWIDIGDEKLHRYYYGSLYYLGATAREDKLIPGIMGNWITTDGVMWNGDYHMNYNMIAPFYGVYTSNRPELARGLKDPLLAYQEEGERRARTDLDKVFPSYITGGSGNTNYFINQGGHGTYTGDFKGREDLQNGIGGGVLYPVALGPWGSTAWQDERGGYLCQVTNAGFSAQALTTYYRYTQDKAYLEDIYPFLVANATFYEQWCEREDLGDGNYRYNLYSGAHEETFELNAPHNIGLVKNILSCLIDTAPLMQRDEAEVSRWKDLFEHLAEYPIEIYDGEDYDFNEYIIPLGEQGIKFLPKGAPVNLEFVCPGNQVAFDTDPNLLEAIKNSIKLKEIADPNTWYQINNTAKIYIMAARAGYAPDQLMQHFKDLLDQQGEENYTINDNVHGIEKAGGIEFIHCMLLQSHNNLIKVFPNWVQDQDAQFCNLRSEGAFLISASYKGSTQTVENVHIQSLEGGAINFVSPWQGGMQVQDEQGNRVRIEQGSVTASNERIYTWLTTKDTTYSIIPQS